MRRGAALAFLSAALLAGCGGREAPSPEGPAVSRGDGMSDQYRYLFLDPLHRFFVPAKDAQGGDIYRVDRAGSVETDLPKSFPRVKGAKTLRVFVVGGSVAQIFNEARLKELLEAALPGYGFEVVDCGMSGYDSHHDLLTVEEVLGYDPDLIVLMSGVNEGFRISFSGKLGRREAAALMARTLLRERSIRAWRLVRSHLAVPVPSRVAADGEKNIARILALAKAQGVPVVLCALPWNFRDMPPRGWPPLWERGFFEAWARFERGDFVEAAERFREHLKGPAMEDPGKDPARLIERSFALYYLARSLERLGDFAGARRRYLASLEDQIPPMPAINRIIRRLGGAYGAPVADLERAFAEASPHGLVGADFFEDEMHWERWCDGMVAAEIVAAAADAVRWQGRGILAPPEAWDRRGLEALKEERAAALRRSGQKREKAWLVFKYRVWNKRLAAMDRLSDRIVALMEMIYRGRPDLLLGADRMKRWLQERVQDNIWSPDAKKDVEDWWPAVMAHIGEFFLREGRYQDALRFFDESLRLGGPGSDYVRLRRAVALGLAGRAGEARAAFDGLRPLDGRYAEIGFYADLFRAGPPPPPGASRSATR